MNFPHKEQNGILRYLYRRSSTYYNNIEIFSYNSSGFYKTHKPSSAFDFEASEYWIDINNPNSGNEVFLSFCFNKGFSQIKGYEIKHPNGLDKPYIWTFSGSNDGINWSFNTTTEYNMSEKTVHYVGWKHGPFKCYRFDFIQNSYNFLRSTDVKQVEIFGTFYPNDFFICGTKKIIYSMSKTYYFIILSLSV